MKAKDNAEIGELATPYITENPSEALL